MENNKDFLVFILKVEVLIVFNDVISWVNSNVGSFFSNDYVMMFLR